MHGWDIRSRLEDDYHLSDGSVAALLDTVDRAARRAFRPDPLLAARPLRYRFHVTRPEERLLDLVLSDATAEVIQGAAANAPMQQPEVTFECNGETCVLILYGRLALANAVADGRLSVAGGDADLAATFGDRFARGLNPLASLSSTANAASVRMLTAVVAPDGRSHADQIGGSANASYKLGLFRAFQSGPAAAVGSMGRPPEVQLHRRPQRPRYGSHGGVYRVSPPRVSRRSPQHRYVQLRRRAPGHHPPAPVRRWTSWPGIAAST